MEYKHAIACAERGDVDFFKGVAPEILLKARDDRDRSVLTVAAIQGHLDCCEVIVERCTQLLYHQNDSPKWSVLHYVAVDNKHENIMRFLICADSKPNLELGGGAKLPNNRLLTMQDYWGGTALYRAVEYRKHGATKLLLEADPDFELLRMVDHDGRTCLHLAADKGDHVSAEFIIRARPSIEFLKMTDTISNHTALHVAAKRGNLEMVKLICDADRDNQLLSMPDSHGNTPLHLASRVEIARLLTPVDMEAKDAIPYAKIGDVDFFKTVDLEILLKARDERDKTVLTVAAREGHFDCCEVIVERCPQLLYHQDIKTKWSVLHFVIAYDKRDKNLENIMGFLITADSKPDLERGGGAKLPNHSLLTMQNIYGKTALHLAAKFKKHGATKLLLEADHDFELLRMVDDDGQTCLHLAAIEGNDVSADLIIAKARHDNEFLKMTESKLNQTALHIAAEKENLAIVQLLLEADHSNDLLVVVDSHKRTTLHYAVKQSNIDMVKLMCKAGLDKQVLSMPDEDKNTPLHLAVRYSNLAIVQMLLEVGNCNNLMAVGDLHQRTALHYAVEQGNLDMVKLMCKAGLDKQLLSMPDEEGNTPLRLAVKNREVEIVRVLTEGDMAIPCAKRGDVDFFKKVAPEILLRARDAGDINTVLTVAAREGHLDCCKVIVERCTPLLYHQDKYKWSVLHDVVRYSEDNLENIMRFLISADSEPDLVLGGGAKKPNKKLLTMQTRWGGTALHLAVRFGKHRAAKLLLQADRDFELQRMIDNNGRTCLHIAVEKGDHVLVKLLE